MVTKAVAWETERALCLILPFVGFVIEGRSPPLPEPPPPHLENKGLFPSKGTSSFEDPFVFP